MAARKRTAQQQDSTATAELMASLESFALGFPGAWADNPWGDSVVKVGKKIFVFLGDNPEDDDDHRQGPRIARARDELRRVPCRPDTGSARRGG